MTPEQIKDIIVAFGTLLGVVGTLIMSLGVYLKSKSEARSLDAQAQKSTQGSHSIDDAVKLVQISKGVADALKSQNDMILSDLTHVKVALDTCKSDKDRVDAENIKLRDIISRAAEVIRVRRSRAINRGVVKQSCSDCISWDDDILKELDSITRSEK